LGQPRIAAAAVARPKTLTIGIVTFLSGPAAAPFGVPARNAAEILIEQLNAGKGPAPYSTPGIGDVPIRAVYTDEAGGADRQVAELRRLVLDEKVDLIIGYISSADALAVAPVAEELKMLTVVFDAGSSQLFENASYTYVFRTGGDQILDNIGAARYVLKIKPDVSTIAGINQNYAWGQDSWASFRDAMRKLKPSVRVVAEEFPKLFASDYSAEISALQAAHPDVIHSSFWGGDLEGLIIQGTPRGLNAQSILVLTTGDTLLPRLGRDLPEGLVIGGKGPHGALAPDIALNRWFRGVYTDRYSVRPVYPSYQMSQAVLGVKVAYERAIKGGAEWPVKEQVISAFEGVEFNTPSGPVRLAIGKGHQAVLPSLYGITGAYNPKTKERDLVRVVRLPAACVNPPAGMKGAEWIAQGFPNAKCT